MTRARQPFRSLRTRLGAFLRAGRRIAEGDVEAVHRARVASRRLRELLPVLGLDRDATSKLSRRLKKVTKQLGAVRELDVLMLMIQELGRDTRYSSTALQQVSAAVQYDRVAARDRLAAKLPVPKIQQLARRLQRAARQSEPANEQGQHRRTLPSGQAWVRAVEARATRRAAGVQSAIEIAGTVYVPERLHDVRIAVKKLRYALELGAEARVQRGSRDITVLKAAQDLLGRLHDLETLIGRARHEQASLSLPALTAWRELDSLVRALEDDCRALNARYMRDRPKLIAIAHRICDTPRHAPLVSRRAVG